MNKDVNKETLYRLTKLSRISPVNIYLYHAEDNRLTAFNEATNHFMHSGSLLISALYENTKQKTPYIHSEFGNIFFASFPVSDTQYIFLGPVCAEQLSFSQKHSFQKKYKIPHDSLMFIPVVELTIFHEVIALTYHLVTSEELVAFPEAAVAGTAADTKENYSITQTELDEDYHHSYKDEKKFTDAVKAGDLEKTLYYGNLLLPYTGKLSSSAINNYRNLAIVGITLCTRAAIDGGANISDAYKTSDLYINRSDKCSDILELRELIFESNKAFVKLVQIGNQKRKYSWYVEQCKYYIDNNYKQDISLCRLAEEIGISPSYLSRIFSKQESISIRQYLTKTRIMRAQNLLKYSDSSLLEICTYVGFTSQSHFTYVFKQQTGITPKQFRNKYKPVELSMKESRGKP